MKLNEAQKDYIMSHINAEKCALKLLLKNMEDDDVCKNYIVVNLKRINKGIKRCIDRTKKLRR
jgi:hypothetical protein